MHVGFVEKYFQIFQMSFPVLSNDIYDFSPTKDKIIHLQFLQARELLQVPQKFDSVEGRIEIVKIVVYF